MDDLDRLPLFFAGATARRSTSSLDPSVTLSKILALVAATAGMLYAGFLCLLYFSQASMIYPGAKNRVGATPPQFIGAEVFKISTALGNVEALFLPATLAVDDTRQPVVIFGHGNGEVIDYWVTALNGFRQRGSVCCWWSILVTDAQPGRRPKLRLGELWTLHMIVLRPIPGWIARASLVLANH
jgi:hypothetical protein